MKVFSVYFLFVLLILANVKGENEKVSPKLDFEESKEETNTSQRTPTSGGKSSNHSPKIQGVRVTVDTGKVKKTSTDLDNKESVEIVETKNKKKVEIHTDITVEISDGDDSNATSPDGEKGENDASVPIFKGRDTTTHRPNRPYEPRVNPWVPVRPQGGVVIHSHHPHPPNVPVFPKTNDEGIYRSIDNWNNFVPITSVWTTEQPYYPPTRRTYDHLSDLRNYQSYTEHPQWKPCYCMSGIHRGFKENSVYRRSSTGNLKNQISAKLESPFSRRKR